MQRLTQPLAPSLLLLLVLLTACASATPAPTATQAPTPTTVAAVGPSPTATLSPFAPTPTMTATATATPGTPAPRTAGSATPAPAGSPPPDSPPGTVTRARSAGRGGGASPTPTNVAGPPAIPTPPPVSGPPAAETAHYRFYDADGTHAAQLAILAAEGEAVYAYVSERTGLSVPAPIPVVVQTPAPSSCAARGVAFNGDGGGRVGIFADAQTSRAQLLAVLAHETVHILHFAAVRDSFDLTLGEGFANWAALPYWSAWQGFASFEEATRTYLEDGRFVPLDNPPADCTIRSRDVIYNERASFTGYLIEAYGRDRLIAASGTSVRVPESSLGSLADYERIYGKRFDVLVEEWLSRVRAGATFGLS